MKIKIGSVAKLHQSIGTKQNKMVQEILLTTGVYDLIKDHLKRKKTTLKEEEILLLQLKKAKQVTRKSLPLDVVTVDSKVIIKNLITNEEEIHTFVAPDKAKRRNNTESILSTLGLALVGCKVGDEVSWDFEEGQKKLQILNVERLA